jgi:hypothetical protein
MVLIMCKLVLVESKSIQVGEENPIGSNASFRGLGSTFPYFTHVYVRIMNLSRDLNSAKPQGSSAVDFKIFRGSCAQARDHAF